MLLLQANVVLDRLAIAITLEKGLTTCHHLLLVLLLIVHGRGLINALGVAVWDRVGRRASRLRLHGIQGRALLLERVHSCDMIRLRLVLIRSITYSAAERHHNWLHYLVTKLVIGILRIFGGCCALLELRTG